MSVWNEFTHQYSLSKTMRFALIPQGKTRQNIEAEGEEGLLKQDEKRAEAYQKAKKLIDQVHRQFIDEVLGKKNLTKYFSAKDFTEAYSLYFNKETSSVNSLTKIKKEFGKNLQKAFDNVGQDWAKKFDSLQKKLPAKQQRGKAKKSVKLKNKNGSLLYGSTEDTFHITKWKIETEQITLKDEEVADSLNHLTYFDKFHSYFTGFNENRANIYDTKQKDATFKKTSIAHRLFEENLDFYFKNIDKWQKLKQQLQTKEIQDKLKKEKWNFSSKIQNCEKKLSFSIKEINTPDKFLNFCSQDGIDRYNQILGGEPAQPGQEKIQGINEIINLTKQQAGSIRLPRLDQLYKQILSEQESRFDDAFESDREVIDNIWAYKKEWFADKKYGDTHGTQILLEYIESLFDQLFQALEQEPELKQQYFLSSESLNKISKEISGNWSTLKNTWYDSIETRKQDNGKPITKKEREKLEKQKYFSFEKIEDLVNKIEIQERREAWQNPDFKLKDYVSKNLKDFIAKLKANSGSDLLLVFESVERGKEVFQETKSINHVKNYLDSCLDLYHFNKSFLVKEKDLGQEQNLDHGLNFYSNINQLVNQDFKVPELYNKVRNYITKKPYSVEKLKLNFENATLADGWDLNKETDNLCTILIKDDQYYLGIMKKEHNQVFQYSQKEKTKEKLAGFAKELESKKTKLSTKKESTKAYEKLSNEIRELEKQRSEIELIAPKKGEAKYQKMVYKLLPGANKMLPKVFFAEKNIDYYNPSQKILDIRNHSSHTKDGTPQVYYENDQGKKLEKDEVKKLTEDEKNKFKKKYEKHDFKLTDCHAMIDFFKASIKKNSDWSCFSFQFSDTKEYKDISDFYRQVESQGYKIDFECISEKYIEFLVEEGRLFLFQIYNKDFSPYANKKKGKKENLHTGYWKMLFDEKNLSNNIFKLNGQAEIFYRKASLKKPFVHKKGTILKHKSYKNIWKDELGLPIGSETKLADLKKKKGITTDDKGNIYFDNNKIGRVIQSEKEEIIKDRRFTKEQFLFHCPITLNFSKPDQAYMKSKIEKHIAENSKAENSKNRINIIGIDRGEKHLLYYTLIDQDGNIKKQASLNTIQSKTQIRQETHYHELLSEKQKQRDQARKSWQEIENIKEIKSGYLSQVVHEIATLIIEKNAIVVLEDLNLGFKRGRFKIEKQVYQKFERALIEKLNYLVRKEAKFGECGHYLKAWQLTEKFESFQKLGKQSGILYYVTASYTSRVDPVTGYVRNLYHRYDKEKTREFFDGFESILYENNHFEFTYDLKKLPIQEPEQGFPVQTKYTISSRVHRSVYDKKSKSHKIIEPTKEIKKLFDDANIQFKEGCVKETIRKQNDTFIKKLHKYFTYLLEVRVIDDSEDSGSDANDRIVSSIYPYFDSKKFADIKESLLPKNGDANGSYNIARKGIILIDKIKLRERLNQLYREESGKDLKWENLEKSLTEIKGHAPLLAIMNEWARLTGREKLTNVEKEKKKFCKFVGNITISKLDWQNYAQRKDIVEKQKKKLSVLG